MLCRDACIQGMRDTGLRGSKTQAMQEFTAIKRNVYVHRKERLLEAVMQQMIIVMLLVAIRFRFNMIFRTKSHFAIVMWQPRVRKGARKTAITLLCVCSTGYTA